MNGEKLYNLLPVRTDLQSDSSEYRDLHPNNVSLTFCRRNRHFAYYAVFAHLARIASNCLGGTFLPRDDLMRLESKSFVTAYTAAYCNQPSMFNFQHSLIRLPSLHSKNAPFYRKNRHFRRVFSPNETQLNFKRNVLRLQT